MNKKLSFPPMTVELRESTEAHGVPSPNTKSAHLAMQLQQTMQMNQDALRGGWPLNTLEILDGYLNEYIVTDELEIIEATANVTGLMSWKEVSVFVKDDACSEFFNMALKYCLREGQDHIDEHGFIDGSGLGYLEVYKDRLKVTLEQCFDAKYFYKTPRPLVYMLEKNKIDLRRMANHLHPGHWAYPAGHGTKFLTAVEVLDEVFALDKNCYRQIFIAAAVCAMGRSGNLIHYPQDNLAGGYLTKLQEFKR